MKKIIPLMLVVFATFAFTAKAQTKSVWTPDYEQAVYAGIDASVKKAVADDAQRKDLVAYVVARFKKQLPDGLESISADSLQKLSMQIGADYAIVKPGVFKPARPHKLAWSADVENILRQSIMEAAKQDGTKLDSKFCDCAIAKLKKAYPDSLIVPLPNEVTTKIGADCAAEINSGTKQNK